MVPKVMPVDAEGVAAGAGAGGAAVVVAAAVDPNKPTSSDRQLDSIRESEMKPHATGQRWWRLALRRWWRAA